MMSALDNELAKERALCLAEAFSYVAGSCQMDIEVFLEMFIISGYAKRLEEGDYAVSPGLSGTELVCRTLSKCGLNLNFPPAQEEFEGASREYWTGYFLAYLSFYTGRPIKNILEYISAEELSEYVPELLAEDEDQLRESLIKILSYVEEPVRLQEMRKECGFSQRELAQRSGINLRTLQQYEVRAKDINKAAAASVKALSDVLGCEMTDIMEN